MNEMHSAPASHPARRLQRTAAVLLLGGVTVLLLAALLPPQRLPVLAFARVPPWPAVVFPVAAALLGVLARGRPQRGTVALLVTGLLAIPWFAIAVQPLGDHGAWRHWATTDRLAASELLGNWLHRLVRLCFGERGMQFVAPCVGVAAVLSWFSFAERAVVATAAPGERERLRAWIAALPAIGGASLVFHRDYVENPMTSLPFLWLGLARLCVGTGGRDLRRRDLVAGVAWLALAALVHGMNATALVAACVVVCVRDGATLRSALRDLAVVTATAGLVVGAVLCTLLGLDFRIEAGHAQGGGDGVLFVPWTRDAVHAFGLFDPAHARAAGDALLAACPLALAAVVALFARDHRQHALARIANAPALGIAATGSFALLFLVHFDLGFPQDLDLMVGIGAPLAPVVVVVLAAGRTRWTVVAAAACAVAHALALAGGLLVPFEPMSPLGARAVGTAEPDVLTANGRSRVCALRPGERVVYRMLAPVGARPPMAYAVYVHRGMARADAPGARACFALPGEEGHDTERTIVLCDGITTENPALPTFVTSLLTPPMPPPPDGEPQVVQAVLRDADGREWTTNAVVVEVRP